jgi:hypothetical protein
VSIFVNIRTARDANASHERLAVDELDDGIDIFAIPEANREVVQADFISRHKFHFAKQGFTAC